jgi:addiction module HigA family antidote
MPSIEGRRGETTRQSRRAVFNGYRRNANPRTAIDKGNDSGQSEIPVGPRIGPVYHCSMDQKTKGRTPMHPGEHLTEALAEIGISAAELARQLCVPTNRITDILNEKRAISADTALRLGHWFGTSAEFWLNLQTLYELRLAENEKGAEIRKLPKRKAA